MKTIDLLLFQGTTKLPLIQLFGVYKGNSSAPASIYADFDGDAYIKNLTTNERTYLTSGEEVEWEIPDRQATDYIIVGQIKELTLNINAGGPQGNEIQEILFNNSKCEKFVYNAFSSNTYSTIPNITGNKYVKEMELTIFGSAASSSSQYIAGTFFQTLSQCNSLGTLKMESGFVTPDNIAAASSKYYTLSALS